MSASRIETLDARGLKCPLPVLKLEKYLEVLPAGTTLILLADDPVARIDVPLACKRAGRHCEIAQSENCWEFTVAV